MSVVCENGCASSITSGENWLVAKMTEGEERKLGRALGAFMYVPPQTKGEGESPG